MQKVVILEIKSGHPRIKTTTKTLPHLDSIGRTGNHSQLDKILEYIFLVQKGSNLHESSGMC